VRRSCLSNISFIYIWAHDRERPLCDAWRLYLNIVLNLILAVISSVVQLSAVRLSNILLHRGDCENLHVSRRSAVVVVLL
jgi:nucleoside recognition membrane protein YjiH